MSVRTMTAINIEYDKYLSDNLNLIEEIYTEIRSLVKSFYPNEDICLQNNKADKVIEITVQINVIKVCLYEGGVCITKKQSEYENYNKREYKNALKRLIYNLLTKHTHEKLAWGILTGVRPVKLSMDMLNQGYNINEIKLFLKEQYYISLEKAELSIKIAKKEIDILKNLDYKKRFSLYIGIPFCPGRCSYCSFASDSIEHNIDYSDEYLKALFKEIDHIKRYNKRLSTVYIGGGTPTSLSVIQLERLLDKVNDSFDIKSMHEYTVEAGRPDSITYDKLKVLKDYGVTRISVNPQTMKQETLNIIGRKHTVKEVMDAFHMARNVGHDNINMDTIIGLPGEDAFDVENTINEICKLQPDSVTVHALAIKRTADFNINKDRYKEHNKSDIKRMYDVSAQLMESSRYEPYYLYRQKNIAGNLENIGYSKQGREGLYNILIMEEIQTIIALGAGSVSKLVSYNGERVCGIKRIENVKNIQQYVNRIDEMIQRKNIIFD